VSHSTGVGYIFEENEVKKVLLATAAVMLIVAASSANASWVLVPGDTTDRNIHGCGSSWEICKYRRGAHSTVVAPKVNGHASACEATCRSKCQASWQVGGYRNVEACYAAWAKINAMGMGERCEAASRARGGRPGPC